MFSARKQLIEYFEQGIIPENRISEALGVARLRPDGRAWRDFIDHLLLWAGGLSLAFSVMFFIAYNWSDIGRFAKFALLEACIVLAIGAYWKLAEEAVAAKLALLMATIFLGVLLALYGQTYQTGADPWQLFFNWALLILPWAMVGRFAAIWIVWILLINLSLSLYFQTFRGLLGVAFEDDTDLIWLLFLFNTAAFISWEALSNRLQWLDTSWAVRLLAIACGVPITLLILHSIFDDPVSVPSILVWSLWLGLMFFYYQKKRPDLFMLAGACLSGIVVVVSFLARVTLEELESAGFLFLAMVVIGLGTAAAVWLRNIHRQWQS